VAAKVEAEIARGAQWLRAQPGRLAGQTAQTLARQLGIREDSAQLALDAAERKLRIGRGPMVLPFVNVRAPGRPGNHFDLRTGKLLPGPVNAPVSARRLVDEALKGNPHARSYLSHVENELKKGNPLAHTLAAQTSAAGRSLKRQKWVAWYRKRALQMMRHAAGHMPRPIAVPDELGRPVYYVPAPRAALLPWRLSA
jgi:hypothetical protein